MKNEPIFKHSINVSENSENILIKRLEPYAQGCFSGNISEWPELKPLLRDIYNFLCGKKKL